MGVTVGTTSAAEIETINKEYGATEHPMSDFNSEPI